MIDYAYLCQTIVDWRAGRRPSMPPSATPTLPGSGVTSTAPIELDPQAASEAPLDEDLDSDLVEVDEQVDTAAEDDVEAPSEGDDLDIAPEVPPDYDSTMVYGADGETQGGAWAPAAPDGEVDVEPDPRDA